MTRVLGPLSISIWEEPGLLVQGHDHPPTVMMGHNSPAYQSWIEALGSNPVKQITTYELNITNDFPPLLQRIIKSGAKKPSIRIPMVAQYPFVAEATIHISN